MLKIFILPENIELNTDKGCLIPSKYLELNDKLYYLDESFDDTRVNAIELTKLQNNEYNIERIVLINEETNEIEDLSKDLWKVDYYETIRNFSRMSEFHIAEKDNDILIDFIINILEYRLWNTVQDISNEPTLFIDTISNINIIVSRKKLQLKSYDDIIYEKDIYNFNVYEDRDLLEEIIKILK